MLKFLKCAILPVFTVACYYFGVLHGGDNNGPLVGIERTLATVVVLVVGGGISFGIIVRTVGKSND